MPNVREYIYESGASPYQEWFDGLDPVTAALVAKAVIKLSLGNYGNLKSLDEGVCEYKIDHGPGYRIYLGFDGTSLIILLGGGNKSTQSRDIASAKMLWEEYNRRKVMATKPKKSGGRSKGK